MSFLLEAIDLVNNNLSGLVFEPTVCPVAHKMCIVVRSIDHTNLFSSILDYTGFLEYSSFSVVGMLPHSQRQLYLRAKLLKLSSQKGTASCSL